jgi:4-cresol dehydrogenase (hydroxylating)
MDKNRLISMTSDNPNTPKAHTTMSASQIKAILEKNKLPCWMIVGSLYGDKSTVSVAKKTIKKQMRKYGAIYFSDSKLIKFARAILKLPLPSIPILNTVREQLFSLSEGTDIMLGIPNQVAMPLAYWRNPRVKPDKSSVLQPDKDGCGLLWYAPLIPMEPGALQDFVNLVRRITPIYKIEPLITFTNLRHDCIDATVPIVFDLENEEALASAHACLDDLIQSGRKNGFVPYRLNPEQQSKLDKNAIFWKVSKKIKQTLDPNNIISPNRYTP